MELRTTLLSFKLMPQSLWYFVKFKGPIHFIVNYKIINCCTVWGITLKCESEKVLFVFVKFCEVSV